MQEAFYIGEKVWILYGKEYFPGDIVDEIASSDGGERLYNAHYSGYQRKWNEIVPASRLLKTNEEGERKRQDFYSNMRRIRISEEKTGSRNLSADDIEVLFVRTFMKFKIKNRKEDMKIAMELPSSLEKILLDEMINIATGFQYVPLPRVPSVRTIVERYINDNKKSTDLENREIAEMCASIIAYFNKFLSILLLFPSEANQLEELMSQKNTSSMCDLYGVEHLIRLLYKLPYLVTYTDMSGEEISRFKSFYHSFAFYLCTHADLFLKNEEYVFEDAYIRV